MPFASPDSEAMRTPLVSVVLPTFNRARLLMRAINSVTAQTFRDWELIVVDDNSTDETPEVMKSIRQARVSYIRRAQNKGGSAARNTGIRAARGRYVAFLDDDDVWLEDKLAEQLASIEGYHACVCACYVNDPNRVKRSSVDEVRTKDLLSGNSFPSSGLMVEASIMKELLFDEMLPKGQDWDVLVRLASKHPIAYVSKPLFIFNDGDHVRITTSARGLSWQESEQRLAAVRKHRQTLGSFWFNYRQATEFLTYLNERPDKLGRIVQVVKRYGFGPTSMVFLYKARNKLKRLFAGRAKFRR